MGGPQKAKETRMTLAALTSIATSASGGVTEHAFSPPAWLGIWVGLGIFFAGLAVAMAMTYRKDRES